MFGQAFQQLEQQRHNFRNQYGDKLIDLLRFNIAYAFTVLSAVFIFSFPSVQARKSRLAHDFEGSGCSGRGWTVSRRRCGYVQRGLLSETHLFDEVCCSYNRVYFRCLFPRQMAEAPSYPTRPRSRLLNLPCSPSSANYLV